MDQDILQHFTEMSRKVGNDAMLVQGSGGNTSYKTCDGKLMYIKASGTSLKEMNSQGGWRCLNVSEVLGILEDEYLMTLSVSQRELEVVKRLQAACVDTQNEDARPSVESHLHAFLGQVVIHTHPLVLLPYVCSKNGKSILEEMFASDRNRLLWIPYADPGYGLARMISSRIKEHKVRFEEIPSVLFLQKHGLVAAGSSPEQVLDLNYRILNMCKNVIKDVSVSIIPPNNEAQQSHIVSVLKKEIGEIFDYGVIQYFIDEEIHKFITHPDAIRLAEYPAVIPEELAYSNGPAVWLETCTSDTVQEKIQERISQGMRPPTSFLVRDCGLFIAGRESAIPMIREVITASLYIRRIAEQFGSVEPMTSAERDFIENWEAESFRINLAQGVKP